MLGIHHNYPFRSLHITPSSFLPWRVVLTDLRCTAFDDVTISVSRLFIVPHKRLTFIIHILRPCTLLVDDHVLRGHQQAEYKVNVMLIGGQCIDLPVSLFMAAYMSQCHLDNHWFRDWSGEPPWPRGSVLGLRPPGLEFRILCLEDSVISIISPASGGSPGPV